MQRTTDRLQHRAHRAKRLTLTGLLGLLAALTLSPAGALASAPLFVAEGEKLVPGNETPDEAGHDRSEFGAHVGISADGATILVGAPLDGRYGSIGGAWVFGRTPTGWSEQGHVGGGNDGPTPDSHVGLGESVALSADGNTALVGAAGSSFNPSELRAYVRTAGTWGPHGVIKPHGEEASIPEAPTAVLTADGREAIVSGGGTQLEAYEQTSSGWTPVQTITPAELSGEGFLGSAAALALSADGSTLLVGEPPDGAGAGAVWAFVRDSSGRWVQQGTKLTVPGGEQFGSAVALSANGAVGLVGEPAAEEGRGTAWLITRSGASWSLGAGFGLTRLPEGGTGVEAEEKTYRFGTSVALTADGRTALIGIPGIEGGKGRVATFPTAGREGTLAAPLTGRAESGAGAFGASLGLAAGSGQLIVGGPEDGGIATEPHGAVWLFAPAPPPLETGPGSSGGSAGGQTATTGAAGGAGGSASSGHGVLGSTAAGPSQAQLLAFLGEVLAVHRASGAKVHRGSWTRVVHAPEAGRLTLSWSLVGPSVHGHAVRILLAAGRTTITRAGSAVLVLHLTRAGLQALAARHANVLATVTFTPPGGTIAIVRRHVLAVAGG